MDYKQKYNELVDAIKVLQETNPSNEGIQNWVNDNVPELRKSKDERIKELLKHYLEVKRCQTKDDEEYINCNHFLAWLEKQGNPNKEYWRGYKDGKKAILNRYSELKTQGEQKPIVIIPKFRVGDEVITENEESLTITRIDEEGYWSNDLFICGFDDSDEWELVEQKPYGQRKECLDCQFNYAGECKGSCAIKRSEQNLVDKIEQKFHEGDWVVDEDDNSVHQIKRVIENITSGNFSYDLVGGGYFPSTKKNYHLWTIADAKDGDVLVDRFSKDNVIILYKGINPKLSVLAYCGWNGYNLSIKTNGLGYGNLNNTNYSLATKEQRDLLFQKMKEAGYEWDANNKELNKIHIIDEGKAEIDYCFTKMMSGENVSSTWSESEEELSDFEAALFSAFSDGWQQYLHGQEVNVAQWAKEHSAELLEVAKQNHVAWSEEDESMYTRTLGILGKCYMGQLPTKVEDELNWFKSIKDKVQPKSRQEWKQENREELTEFENAMMHIGGSFFGENAGLDPNDTDTIKEQAELLLELALKQEWSEEDERMLNLIIQDYEAASKSFCGYKGKLYWLKSFKKE